MLSRSRNGRSKWVVEPQGVLLSPACEIHLRGSEEWRASRDQITAARLVDSTLVELAARGDDLAVARMSLEITLAASLSYRPHGGGWPLAYGVPARAVPAAVVLLAV